MATETKVLRARVSPELIRRIHKQRKKEKRNLSEFLRRVLDKYLLDQEFRTPSTIGVSAEVVEAAHDSAERNQKLHRLLRNA